jgi:hypothetical protein
LKRNILIAPKNDLSTLYKNYTSTEYNFLFYVDSYKKDIDSISISNINNDMDYDEIIILSPNYYKEIFAELVRNNISKKKIYFAIPNDSDFTKVTNIFYAGLLYKKYKYKEKLLVYYNNLQLFLLKNKHKNKRIFLIGNGPSLKIEDLDKLKNEITFAANKIYLSYDQTDFRPTYYLVEDDLVYKQNYKNISSLKGSIKFFPSYAKRWERPLRDGIYFKMNLLGSTTENFPNFHSNPLDEGLYWGSTVIYTMIEFAVYFGCNEIYLLGVDFSFEVPDTSEYNKYENRIDLICNGEVNHFHKDYRKIGEKWNLPNLDVQLKSFTKAKEYCDSHGIRIYNVSRRTKLDIFEKINFDTLF